MKMKRTKANKGLDIKAYIISSPNATNGKYRAAQIGLDTLEICRIKDSDIFFLETLKVRAASADKMIAEAESEGKDTNDLNVIKELGEKINALGKPIHQSQSIMTATFVSLQIMALYGIAIAIWGLVFKKSFLGFGLYGVIVGFFISLLSVAPVVAFQRTKERIRDIVTGVGNVWGSVAIIIAVVGLVVWVIRVIFFSVV